MSTNIDSRTVLYRPHKISIILMSYAMAGPVPYARSTNVAKAMANKVSFGRNVDWTN